MQRITRPSFQRRILLYFTFATAILMTVGYFGYRSVNHVGESKQEVDHTFIVIDNLKEILSSAKDVQSAQRGYVITGEKNYLLPYSSALPKIETTIISLEKLTSDNPAQQKRLADVRIKMDKRLSTAAKIIAAHDNEGPDAASKIIRSGSGIKEMVELGEAINVMVGEENKLLLKRQQLLEEEISFALKLGAIGLLFCILILIVVFRQIINETNKREETERSLHSTLKEMSLLSQENFMLSKMSDYLQSCKTVNEAYDVIGKILTGLFPNTKGGVFIFNNSRNYLELATQWGEELSTKQGFAQDECWALRRGQMHNFISGNLEANCDHMEGQVRRNYTCLPLMINGEILGLFHMEGSDDQEAPTKFDLMRRVGEQIAMAVGNLNLQTALREQSIRDPLTHLYNRRYLETTIERELSRARRNKQPLGILVIDIDHFKKFNDTMGHDAGDALLVHFGKLLERNIRKEDIACRYGGEEFVVALPMASLSQTIERAQVILDAARKMRVQANNKELDPITISIGVTAFPEHGSSLADLITVADQALYKAKNNGRNQSVVGEAAELAISL